MNLRTLAIGAGLCALSLVLAFLAIRPFLGADKNPGRGAVQSPHPGIAMVAPVVKDDATVLREQYDSRLHKHVTDLMGRIPTATRSELAAGEMALPTMALPILKLALVEHPNAALSAALEADSIRMHNAAVRSKTMEWYRAHTVALYDQSPHNPGWDKQARAVIIAMAQVFSQDPDVEGDLIDFAWEQCKQAKANPDDPLFQVMMAYWELYSTRYDHAMLYTLAAKDRIPKGGAYDTPWIRLRIELAMLPSIAKTPTATPEEVQTIDRHLKVFDKLFISAMSDATMPRVEVNAIFAYLGEMSLILKQDRLAMQLPLLDKLDAIVDDKSGLLTARGNAEFGEGVDAMRAGEGVERGIPHLKAARQALQQAWALDNSNAAAAVGMLRVSAALDDDVTAIRHWMNLAHAADPDDRQPYEDAIAWLYSMGDTDEMTKLADECVDGGRYDTTIPWQLIRTSLMFYFQDNRPDHSIDAGGDFFDTHRQLWPKLYDVYQKTQAARGESRRRRLAMGFIAYKMGHFPLAQQLLNVRHDNTYPFLDDKAYSTALAVCATRPDEP